MRGWTGREVRAAWRGDAHRAWAATAARHKCAPKATVPGRDGITYAELAYWPDRLIALFLAVYERVEFAQSLARPPQPLHGCHAREGGPGRVDDYPPIVLLGFIYRIWARGHGRDPQRWLLSAGVATLHGGQGGRAAGSQALVGGDSSQGWGLGLR